ncbi:hypothetical protein KC19_12G101800 [Ceratodon purpureus]|uniref:Transmembrane protein n=1 Tax=Ceratodon purpureus TaxID=3225 RepID=A0A8T0G5L8_CERPU|nr:hypothetical protein KC19_12G101800 [Ceratodon purpureus]
MNGEQVEVATRTMVAGAIVSFTAIYLIYKKKLAQRNYGYSDFNIGSSMCPPTLNSRFWKNKKNCILVVVVIIICIIFIKRNELQNVGIPNLNAIGRREQENFRRQDCQDPYAHPLRHNPLYHPPPHHHGR